MPMVAKKLLKSVELPLTGGSQPHPHINTQSFLANVTQKRFRLVFLWKRTETVCYTTWLYGGLAYLPPRTEVHPRAETMESEEGPRVEGGSQQRR